MSLNVSVNAITQTSSSGLSTGPDTGPAGIDIEDRCPNWAETNWAAGGTFPRATSMAASCVSAEPDGAAAEGVGPEPTDGDTLTPVAQAASNVATAMTRTRDDPRVTFATYSADIR
jgi:hypothetical protein